MTISWVKEFAPILLRCAAALFLLSCTALRAQGAADAAEPSAPPQWGWQKPIDHAPPAAPGEHPIDAFVRARLEAGGLTMANPAERATLMRRATYDLTGLPPTPEEVSAFCADDSPDAWQQLIDRLLASPQYGVKWGRHWLDVVRFAETDSYERDRLKPGAWRYRDWVVGAFNSDKPYDQFIVEQLAGDEIDNPTLESVVATGFYRLGIWDDEPTDLQRAIYDDLDGIADTTARAFLGVSMGCARCHDHKRDPLPTADYYRFLSVFEGIKPYKANTGNSTTPANYLRTVSANLGGEEEYPAQLAEWRRRRQSWVREAQSLADEVRAHLDPAQQQAMAARAHEGRVAHLSFDRGEDLAAIDGLQHGTWTAGGLGGGALELAGGNRAGGRIPHQAPDDFTLSVWFRTEQPGRGSRRDLRWFTGTGLIDGEVPGIVDDFGLSLVEDHVCAGLGNPETFLRSAGGYADGEWHHAVLTRERESGLARLYVDGVLADEKTGSTLSMDSPPSLTLGRMQPDRGGLRGGLDEVAIYRRALSPQQVLELWSRGGDSTTGGGFEDGMAAIIAERIGSKEAARYRAAVEQLRTSKRPTPSLVEVLCVREAGPAIEPTHVRLRGNAHVLGEEVTAAVPRLFGGAPLVPQPRAETSGRRHALAQWLVGDGALFTARVMANRVWQHHFGRAIARDPNDFGRLGVPPTHPKLLDWLAHRLVDDGWSIKALHRRIMNSAVYRSSYRHDEAAFQSDPLNDLMWRFDLRRLTAEEIRDSMLAVAGTLELEQGGPGVYPPLPKEVLATSSRPDDAWGKSPPEQANRRSLYIHVKRSMLHPLLLAFDLADTDASCPVRFATTQPTQALTLMNSDASQEVAAAFAQRVAGDADDLPAQVARALSLTRQGTPTYGEVAEGVDFVVALQRKQDLTAGEALRLYCLVLLNSNAFVFVD